MENTFGKYRIAAPIATKSSNPVYRARPVTATEWGYVVKVFNDHKVHTLVAQEEWRQNMAELMHLEHPYILPIIETGIEEEVPYSVTKYMEGGSLRDRLNQIFPEQLAIQDVRKIILQVGQALQYAHDHHILHGNIKPENILFNEHDDAVLSDFRVPQHADETDPGLPIVTDFMQELEEIGDDSKLQLTYYPALESLSEKSDQYALGCLAYELLTGRLQTAMLSSKLPSVHPLPKKTVTAASPSDHEWIRQIETVLRKAVGEEPDARYENVAAFLEVFEQVCSSRSSAKPAAGVTLENWPLATLLYARTAVRQLPTLRAIKAYSWWRSDRLMQIYKTYKENAAWRWSAIIVPLVILVTFCLLLISRFSSSQPSWQAVATPTLQTASGTVVGVTQQSDGFALPQQVPTPTPTIHVNTAPSVSSGSGPSTTSAATSSSDSGSHKSHKSHKSSHSSSSSSGSSSDSSSSGSSSDSSSSGSSSSSSPTPTPTPFVTPTPTPWPTSPGSTGSHCAWGNGCNSGGRGGGWGGWGW